MFLKEKVKSTLLRLYNLLTYRHFIKENNYAHIFNDAKKNIPWLSDKVFFPSKSAANYSLLYILLRILLDIKPNKILEFGLGQTSTLTSAYAVYNNSQLRVVEHNKEWIDIYKSTVNLKNSNNISFVHSKLRNANLNKYFNKLDFSYQWYEEIPEDKYDLIILDGPTGTRKFARCGIIELLPTYLAENFIIVIDDYNVYPTRQTVVLIKKILNKHGILFKEFITEGTKQQMCIVSEEYAFLSSI